MEKERCITKSFTYKIKNHTQKSEFDKGQGHSKSEKGEAMSLYQNKYAHNLENRFYFFLFI